MTAAKTYHHGDLQAALLAAARAKLGYDGYEALSLRALARDIGVASSAPYAHFKSRDALLWALVEEGGRELGALFGAIADDQATATAKLAMAARAFLAFAKAEPELMRLMFVSPLTTERVFPAGAARSLDIFEGLVADVMVSRDTARIRHVAIGCWSALHGFAMLRLHNRLAPDIDIDSTTDAIVEASVRLAQTARLSITGQSGWS